MRREVAREHPEAGDEDLFAWFENTFERMRSGVSRRWAATVHRWPARGGDTAPATAGVPVDPLDRLERLATLRERGVLTDEEFAAQKQALLALSTSSQSPA